MSYKRYVNVFRGGVQILKLIRYHFVIPLLLLVINIVLTLLLIEELIDASDPNYGTFSLLTPFIGLISFIYIRMFVERRHTLLVRTLQSLNWIFILFPIIILLMTIALFTNY